MVRSRYPRAWDRQPLAAVGSAIEWSEQIQITCGLCRRSLGKYRSYHVHDEYGIVEDTPRSYEPSPGVRRSPGSRAPRSKPRYMIDGEIAGHAAKATARFHCPGCRADYDRNLARLGRELMELTEPRLTLHR